jgi:REP element-mobilizing transposase RayT
MVNGDATPSSRFSLLFLFFLIILRLMSSEHRPLPHLAPFSRHPMVFLTVVTRDRLPSLSCQAALDILTNIWIRSLTVDGWSVGRFMLMPDHVHLFARAFLEAKPLADWVGTWKSLSSRKITIALSATPPFWQKNYFDRFVRSTDDYEEKWRYVEMNPVRKGLCSQSAEWPWQGEIFDLRY